jgi:hypothetical protein
MVTPIDASRRRFLAQAAAGASAAAAAMCGAAHGRARVAAGHPESSVATDRAPLVAITLDLEMSRNFPDWETTHWDYEKGNLNDETKRYAVEACRRVNARGGVVHAFAVGRVFEQENVDWLREIAEAGHPIGNHTYDHVNILATKAEDLQFRFRRAPWLIAGKTTAEVIAENIRLTNVALKERLGIAPAGFRAPGGFADGLVGRDDIQQMLAAQGFDWVSTKYPAHTIGAVGGPPTKEVLGSIVAAGEHAQPFTYRNGLIEVPMSPISDIGAFRSGRWKLEVFLEALRRALRSAIERGAVFDFLGHPSCLYVTDPTFRAIELICDEAERGGAEIVELGTVARRGKGRM